MKIRKGVVYSSIAAAALILGGCATNQKQSIAQKSEYSLVSSNLSPMPEGVTSFGAVTTDGWLYVFGGHKGERHEYSAEMVSGSFHRLNLGQGRKWEVLQSSAPGQGLPLVARQGYVFRIGGMAAANSKEEKQSLVSTNLVQRFNPATKRWENLPSLPAGRSSHDAVVLNDKIYVIGGWNLSGSTKEADWPATGLILDLKNISGGWTEFAQPFRRRALAVAAKGNRIYAIGGMDSDNKTTLAVAVYDTQTGKWSNGPDLPPGGRIKGFGCSAIGQNGQIYANTFQGNLLRLSADEQSWEVAGKLDHARIAHRIVTAGKSQIIALGGEDGEAKRPELELLTPKEDSNVAQLTN